MGARTRTTLAAVGLLLAVACTSSDADHPVRFLGADARGPDALTIAADVPADHVGLAYGEAGKLKRFNASGVDAVCLPVDLLIELTRRKERLEAWAEALDIEAADAKAFVATLRPAIVTRHVLAGAHGFRDGPTAADTVIEEGTAVLVDADGALVARCHGGQALRPPSDDAAEGCEGCPPGMRELPEPCGDDCTQTPCLGEDCVPIDADCFADPAGCVPPCEGGASACVEVCARDFAGCEVPPNPCPAALTDGALERYYGFARALDAVRPDVYGSDRRVQAPCREAAVAQRTSRRLVPRVVTVAPTAPPPAGNLPDGAAPNQPDAPGQPDAPRQPSAPEQPGQPREPDAPGEPDAPNQPEQPTQPDAPRPPA